MLKRYFGNKGFYKAVLSLLPQAGLAEARDRIQNERVIELAFEDQYFYDILRWKEGPQHIGNIVYGVNVQRKVDPVTQEVVYDYSRTKVDERVFQERMYHYPIPRTEVYNLGTEQNPGW